MGSLQGRHQCVLIYRGDYYRLYPLRDEVLNDLYLALHVGIGRRPLIHDRVAVLLCCAFGAHAHIFPVIVQGGFWDYSDDAALRNRISTILNLLLRCALRLGRSRFLRGGRGARSEDCENHQQ